MTDDGQFSIFTLLLFSHKCIIQLASSASALGASKDEQHEGRIL